MEDQSEKEVESQWTVKRIIIRLIAYPFCILLFWGCYHMVFNTDPNHTKQFAYGLLGFGIGGMYIVSDIIMIIKSIRDQ